MQSNRTDQDLAAAELLNAFRLNKAEGVSSSALKKESIFYLKPVYFTMEDGLDVIEKVVDSKPC